jgi:copper resistance protein C
VGALLIVGVAAAPSTPAAPRVSARVTSGAALHLHLERSEPAANDTITTAPSAVRLWFSEQPELAVTTVRLNAAAGGPVGVAPLTRDAGADAPVVAPLRGVLVAGAYTVWWRSTARDGHVSTGQFQFVVAPTGSKPGAK